MNVLDSDDSKPRSERTVIFGGTFDPPHAGHLSLARELLKRGFASHIIFVPAGVPPHKQGVVRTAYEERLTLVKIMCEGVPGISVSEIERPVNTGPSYTIRTLEALQVLRPDESLALLIGSDSLEQLHTWHRAEELVQKFELIVYPREGYEPTIETLSTCWHPELAQKLCASSVEGLPTFEVASRDIRADFKTHLKHLHPKVLRYIQEKGFYGSQKRKSLFRHWKLGFGIVLCLWLWAALLGYIFSDYLIFAPHAPGYEAVLDGFFKIPLKDSEYLAAYTVPTPNAQMTVLYFHGNGEDISENLSTGGNYAFLGVQPYVIDYRGYGLSSGGFPSPRTFYEDAESAYRYLTETKKVPPSRIILHGRSLGGAAAISLAARHPVAGLIAESTFLSAFQVVTRWPVLPLDKMRSDKAIGYVNCPKLFIHGKKDWVVGFSHGERLFALAKEPKYLYWAGAAGHNDVEGHDPQTYWRVISTFVDSITPPSSE